MSKPVETFVNIIVSGNLSDGPGLVFAKGVNARIYFSENVTIKAKDYDNSNMDLGPVASSNATAPVLKFIPPPNPLSGAAMTFRRYRLRFLERKWKHYFSLRLSSRKGSTGSITVWPITSRTCGSSAGGTRENHSRE